MGIGKTYKGIKGRWFLNSFSFVLAIMIIAIAIIGIGTSKYYYSSVKQNVSNRAESTASFFNKYMTKTYDQFYNSAEKFVTEFIEKDKLEVQIIDAYGRVLLSSSALTAGFIPSTGDVIQAFSDKKQVFWIGVDHLTDEKVISVTSPVFYTNGNLLGAVRYVSSLKKVDIHIATVILISVLIGMIFIFLLMVSNRYFITSIVEPVARINVIAKEIAQGRYGMRLQKIHNDEIGDLCDTINYMSDEISRAEKMKNDFISSVSHELRTPLTAIAGWSETLMSGEIDDTEEIVLGLGIIRRESVRLTQMVEELLEFARLENGAMRLNVEPFDVCTELYDSVYMYASMLRREGMDINYHKPREAFFISGDRYRLKQVFLNIIDNAAKYGKDGKKVDISIDKDENNVIIHVRDYGFGIAPEELPFVKQKFYKGSSKQRGSGIGLAVTDEIIKLHGGELDISSTLSEGTTVSVTLPAFDMDREIEE